MKRDEAMKRNKKLKFKNPNFFWLKMHFRNEKRRE